MPKGMLRPGFMAVSALILLFLAACQLSAINTGSDHGVTISIHVPAQGLSTQSAGAGTRYLTPANQGKVGVRITRLDSGEIVYRQDVSITNNNGKAQAQVQAAGIPVATPLSLSAWIEDGNGVALLLADADFTVQSGVSLDLPVTLAPDPAYPGYSVMGTGDLVLPPGGAALLSRAVQAGEKGKNLFMAWPNANSTVVFAAISETGEDYSLKYLASGRGIEFNAGQSDRVIFLAFNTGSTAFNLGPAGIGNMRTVTFNYQDGNGTAPLSVHFEEGGLAIAPANPVRPGFNFAGWYKDSQCTPGNKWNFASDTLGVDINLYARWTGFNLSLGFTLNVSQPGKNISFASQEVVVAADSTLTLSSSDAVLAAQTSGWKWYVDGVPDTVSSGGTFVFDPAGASYGAGNHVVSVVTSQAGVDCSGSLKVTVSPVSVPVWSISYLFGDSDAGIPPANVVVTGSPASATVAGAGTLSKQGSDFVGWTLVYASGSYPAGAVFAPGDSLSVSADMVFTPRWALVSMVDIPGGTFCRDGVTGNYSTVSSFRIGKFAVTQDQYREVMTGNSNGLSVSPSSSSALDTRPVENVSWYAALVFCNRLSIKEGLTPVYSISANTNPDAWGTAPTADDSGWNAAVCDMNANGYRLPMEAEWMWAAMGGMADSIVADIQNGINTGGYSKTFAGYNGTNSGAYLDYVVFGFPAGQAPTETASVGTRLPNEFGLYDMSGNVYSWCWDWNNTGTRDNPGFSIAGPVKDNPGPAAAGTTPWRLIHGGSWSDSNATLTNDLSLAFGRKSQSPYYADGEIGLRVVRSGDTSRYLPMRSLVGEWYFDGTNTNPLDTSGYGTWTSSLGTRAFIAGRKSIAETAYHISSATTFTTDHAIFGKTDPFTVSMWIRPQAYPGAGTHYLVTQQGSAATQFQYWITIDSSGNLDAYIAKNGDSTRYEILAPVSTAIWTHVLVTWTPPYSGNAGTMKLWMNGSLAGSLAVDVSTMINPNSTGTFQIGGGWASGTVPDLNYAGGIDDLRMYKRVLSDAEILELYQE